MQTRRSIVGKNLESGVLTELNAEFLDLGVPDGLDRFDGLVSSSEIDLVVTAARTGFDAVAERLLAVERRRVDTLIVISADNTPPQSWLRIGSLRPHHLDTSASIADRVCVRFPRTDPHVDVLFESYAHWVVESDAQGVCAQRLGQSEYVTVVTDLQPWRRRKLFCVNGLQLALALHAHVDGYPDLDSWIRDNLRDAQQLADALAAAFAKSAGEEWGAVEQFCKTSLDRFAVFPDVTRRILGLKEGQRRGDPTDLRGRVNERLEPLLTFDETGRIEAVISHATAVIASWR